MGQFGPSTAADKLPLPRFPDLRLNFHWEKEDFGLCQICRDCFDWRKYGAGNAAIFQAHAAAGRTHRRHSTNMHVKV
jgi:hypothetical protein